MKELKNMNGMIINSKFRRVELYKFEFANSSQYFWLISLRIFVQGNLNMQSMLNCLLYHYL